MLFPSFYCGLGLGWVFIPVFGAELHPFPFPWNRIPDFGKATSAGCFFLKLGTKFCQIQLKKREFRTQKKKKGKIRYPTKINFGIGAEVGQEKVLGELSNLSDSKDKNHKKRS